MFSAQTDSAQWMFELQGRRFGPVNTQTIESLCRSGVIVPSTSVHSTLSNRWSFAVSVPAMRPWLAAPLNQPASTDLLGNIPSVAIQGNPSSSDEPASILPVSGQGMRWILALLFFGAAVVGTIGFFTTSDKSTSFRIGYAVGMAVGTVVGGFVQGWIFSWVAYFVFGRSRLMGATGFAGSVLLMLLSLCTNIFQKAHKAEAPAPVAQQPAFDASSLQKLLASVSPKPGPTSQPARTLNLSKDTLAITELGRNINQEIFETRMRYTATLRQAHIDRVLTAQNLADPASYAASRRACQTALDALKTAEQEQRRIAEGIPARVRACNISDRAKEAFLAGFNRGRADEELYLTKDVALERQQIVEMVAVLDLMQPYAGKLVVTDGRIKFPRPDLVDAYNIHIRNLQAIASAEKQLQVQHQKDVQQRLSELATVSE